MTLGRTILMAAGFAAVSFAQQWEFGGVAGGGFLNTTNVNNSLGSATAGFRCKAPVKSTTTPHTRGTNQRENRVMGNCSGFDESSSPNTVEL